MIVESQMQRDAGINFTVEEAFLHVMEYAHWSTNAAAIKRVIELSGETIDQFKSEFSVATGLRPDNYGAGHASIRANFQSDPKDSKTQARGVDRMAPLQQWIEAHGGSFLFNHAADALLVDNQGKVTGAQLIAQEGAEKPESVTHVNAAATVVATGGFLGSPEMMLEKLGTHVNPLGNVLSDGAGITMVEQAGGVLSTQWGIAGNEFSGSNQKTQQIWQRTNAAYAIGIYGTLLVNNQGRRFSNEGKFANLPLALGGAISLVGGKYYAIVDQAYVDALNTGKDAWTVAGSDEQGWPTGKMTLANKPLEKVQENIDKAVEEGWVYKADSIAELVKATGLVDLETTLARYNEQCHAKRDDDFYKPSCFMIPVEQGPFYAMEYEPSAWVTIGGVRTNDRMQAINKAGEPIGGLYVAGADNGTLMSAPYCDYEGYSLMCAYAGGRLAGMSAAADA